MIKKNPEKLPKDQKFPTHPIKKKNTENIIGNINREMKNMSEKANRQKKVINKKGKMRKDF